MIGWWLEAVLRVVATALLVADLGWDAFGAAAVVGVMVGWAAIWRRALHGALATALIAMIASAWLGHDLEFAAFGVLKVVQAVAIGATAGRGDWRPGGAWRVAGVVGMILVAVADAGLVGLGLVGATLS